MGIRDIILFATVFGLLPFCVARPYIGLLSWTWIGYMNPHRLAYGVAYDFPFAQLVAVATIFGIGFAALRGRGRLKLHLERETFLLLLLWGMFIFTTFFALRPDWAWPELSKISKILSGAFITIMLVDNEKKLKYLLIVIAFSLGFYGVKGGIFSIAAGGQHLVFGPGGFIGGNNSLGLALNMILPILFFFGKMEKNRWIKTFLYSCFLLTILAILFTYSRGAALGLFAVLCLITLSCKLRTKLVIIFIALISIPVTIAVVPDRLVDRVDSIGSYQEDGSAQARLRAWRAAWLLAVDRPLVGGGFQIIDDKEALRRYSEEYADRRHAGVHSIVFEVLGENGFPTAIIFFLLILSTMISLRNVRLASLRGGQESFYCYAKMLEVGLVGYLVTGLFLEMASFDLFYQFTALAIVLKAIYPPTHETVEGKNLDEVRRQPLSLSLPGQSL